MKYKLGETVDFYSDGELYFQEGRGVIIRYDEKDDLYLIQSEDIVGGHSASMKDGSTDKFWFEKEELQEVEKPKSPHLIMIGDKIRFKTLDQMLEEFGEDQNGSPDVLGGWVDDMDDLCGKAFKVKEVNHYGIQNIDDWTISFDMIELLPEVAETPIVEDHFKVGDRVRIRTIDELIEEYGSDSTARPIVEVGWTMEMDYLEGREFTIEKLNGNLVQPIDNWGISLDMLEKVEDKVDEPPHLTCREFEEEIGKFGLTLTDGRILRDEHTIAQFTTDHTGEFDTRYLGFRKEEPSVQRALVELLTRIAFTPVEIRDPAIELTEDEVSMRLGYKVAFKW